MESPPQDVAAEQSRQNRTTVNQWQFYAAHRQAIEKLIVPAATGGRIAVLGAGNCNDLDLKWLADVYRHVDLIDLDPAAPRAAIERQGCGGCGRIKIHAPVDLTGIGAAVSKWQSPSRADLDACMRLSLEWPPIGWEPADVVLSACVLTQTINPVRDAMNKALPPSHPAVKALRSALRARHLRLMAASLKPGGRGVLAIDLVSSQSCAELVRTRQEDAHAAMRALIDAGKNFQGLDPTSIKAAFASDPDLRRSRASLTYIAPWIWHLSLRRSFLVYAAIFWLASN